MPLHCRWIAYVEYGGGSLSTGDCPSFLLQVLQVEWVPVLVIYPYLVSFMWVSRQRNQPTTWGCSSSHMARWRSLWAAVHGLAKNRTRLSNFAFTFHFPALEKEMATHSSVLGWRIPGMGEPGGLLSMGSHRVGHDWRNLAAAAMAVKGCCWITQRRQDSWPPEEKNSIRGQRRGLITQSFCVIKFCCCYC